MFQVGFSHATALLSCNLWHSKYLLATGFILCDTALKGLNKVPFIRRVLFPITHCCDCLNIWERWWLLLVIMPPSALDHLTRLNINYPMLFKLTNPTMERVTHCGVLEFVAGEGKVYLPHWMMHNLMLDEGGVIQVESVSLPVATFSRFQPQSPDFLDISNPKAVLENCLRNFACLTAGDVVNIKYNQKDYQLSVLETQPGEAVSIIECDMNVEFAPPLGYQEPSDHRKKNDATIDPVDLMPEPRGFVKFRGEGYRLDGKRKRLSESEAYQGKVVYSKGIPDYDWKFGTLAFIRNIRQPTEETTVEDDKSFSPFSGGGNTLSKPK